MSTVLILSALTSVIMLVGMGFAVVSCLKVLKAIDEDRWCRRKKRDRKNKARRTKPRTSKWWSGWIGTLILFGVGPVAFFLAPPWISDLAVKFFMVGGLTLWVVVFILILPDILRQLMDIVRQYVRR
ncbi:MAG: hypothetical protein ACYDEV_03005 [Acidiferrobacter sp.]